MKATTRLQLEGLVVIALGAPVSPLIVWAGALLVALAIVSEHQAEIKTDIRKTFNPPN